MGKRLLLDLEKCATCKEMKCACSYPRHPFNKGMNALLEYAAFAFICRQCEEAPCVNSCPKEALEKLPNSALKRYNVRCVSCKSCMLACPFGTIIPEIVPYLSSKCDLCAGRLKEGEEPVCVTSCPYGVLEYVEVIESAHKNLYIVNDNLAVHCTPWRKPDPAKR